MEALALDLGVSCSSPRRGDTSSTALGGGGDGDAEALIAADDDVPPAAVRGDFRDRVEGWRCLGDRLLEESLPPALKLLATRDSRDATEAATDVVRCKVVAAPGSGGATAGTASRSSRGGGGCGGCSGCGGCGGWAAADRSSRFGANEATFCATASSSSTSTSTCPDRCAAAIMWRVVDTTCAWVNMVGLPLRRRGDRALVTTMATRTASSASAMAATNSRLFPRTRAMGSTFTVSCRSSA